MERNKVLKEKWNKLIEVNKENSSVLPINESEKAMFEQLINNLDEKYISEQTFSGDMARISNVLLPVYRRAFPMMYAKGLVGLQPMEGPTGQAFALRYHYAGNSAGNDGSQVLGGGKPKFNALSGNWTPSDNQRNGLNSLLLAWSSTAARQTDAPDVGYGDAPVAATGDLTGLATVIYSEDNLAVIRFAGTGTTISDITDLVGATGTGITNYWANEAGYKNILKSYPGPLETLVGEKLGMDMQELGLTIDKTGIEAETYKLKTRYTIESAQDLKAAHGKDMATELIDILTYEIAQAIDRRIMSAINEQAVETTFDISSADGRWQDERFKSAYTEFVRKSNDIAKTTLRSPGNFIVGSSDVITMIENIPSFRSSIGSIENNVNTSTPVNNTTNGYVGTIGGRFSIYHDIFAANNYATIGYKGVSAYDAGVIYCPYIPIMMKETTDQENGNNNIIFMERSAIAATPFSADRYYRKVNINGLFE